MDLKTKKESVVPEFVKHQDEQIYEPLSAESLKARIEEAESDFKAGKFKSSAQLLAKYKS